MIKQPHPIQFDNKDILRRGISFRYFVGIISATFLYVFRDNLPFPFPHFCFLSVVLIFVNVSIHLSTYLVKDIRKVTVFAMYADIGFAPLIFLFTGGFLSPFILIHFVTVIGSCVTFTESKYHAKNLLVITIVSYVLISLLQKYSFLPNTISFSRVMMQNDLFFYYTMLTVTTVLSSGLMIIAENQKHLYAQLEEAINSLNIIVAGTTANVGKDFFNAFVKYLAHAFRCECVFLGEFNRTNERIELTELWPNQAFSYHPVSLKIDDLPFKNHLDTADTFLIEGVNFFEKTTLPLNVDRYCGIMLNDDSGKSYGCVVACSKGPFKLTYQSTSSILKIFASRISAELYRKRVEDDKVRLQNQFAQAQKMQAIGQLAGGVAHDFNNLLTGIIGYSSILKSKITDTNLKRYAQQTNQAAKKAADLTGKLLSFAQKGKYESRPVDLHIIILDVIQILEHTIDKNVTIRNLLHAEKSITMGDPSQLQSSVLNLALNARDAMPEGGSLVIATSNVTIGNETDEKYLKTLDLGPGTYIKVVVSDTGIGMNTETLSYIFEPFFTTKAPGKGTGLGLAVVYGTIKNHQGAINVESIKGKGTTISFYLPAFDSTSGTLDTKATPMSEFNGKKRVLVIDDEEIVARMINDILISDGFKVQVCNDGGDAINILSTIKNPFDCAILDMIMPKKNGLDTFYELKRLSPHMKVLVISGYILNEQVQKLLDSGASGFIQKPFSDTDLLNEVHRILE